MTQVRAWYLVQCKPRQDERAEENLIRQGYQCVRPLCARDKFHRGRRQLVIESLFPGYLFIHMPQESSWAPLRSTRGVSRIVSFGGSPLAVGEELIISILERAELEKQISLNATDSAVSMRGGCSELDGIFMSTNGEERVLLLINILNRQQQVELQ